MGCSPSTTSAVTSAHTRPPYAVSQRSVFIQTDFASKAGSKMDLDAVETEESTVASELLPDYSAANMHHGVSRRGGHKWESHTGLGHDPQNTEDTWLAVCRTLDLPEYQSTDASNLIVHRTGWKTVRIFVSSTFRDFHSERNKLVKEVFPDLRAWCEKRRLHLVECDLRWGIPKDSTTELTLRTCLGEIDRCYEDNIMPYFLNMSSERIGWIPMPGDVPQNLVEEYRWVFGLSMTEMEIVHGAYRKDNPNSLFLIRDDSFLNSMPEEQKDVFIDENPIAPAKLAKLRKMISDKFPAKRIITYGCQYSGLDAKSGIAELNLDPVFQQSVFEFFKQRIAHQYPLEEVTVNMYQKDREAHEAFMKQRAEQVIGRRDILEQVFNYVNDNVSNNNNVPLLLHGGAGTGKTSLMAKAADATMQSILQNTNNSSSKRHIFYHFVGAVPGSSFLEQALRRLLLELQVVTESTMPKDVEELAQLCSSSLANSNSKPVILFIDAVNQFHKERSAEMLTWLPRQLSPNVRCILSMITDSKPQKVLLERDLHNEPLMLQLTPLDLSARKDIVQDVLNRYNKRLDMDQMILLLSKHSSSNPLWLSIACEELRVFGDFFRITDKIKSLKDSLLELLEDVLSRFEEENGGHLLVATLCLLEVSATGLLEAELLSLLADEKTLTTPAWSSKQDEEEKHEKETNKSRGEKLPAYKWAMVYRALRTFLRPYGDSGEGRLDFYHRSVSKAVRKKYFKVSQNNEESDNSTFLFRWWHKMLADFYENSDNLDRQVEEYPHHLIHLGDGERLKQFLCRTDVIDKLFHEEYSSQLISFWREGGDGRERMTELYKELCMNYINAQDVDKNEAALKLEKIAKILMQAGSYDEALELAQIAYKFEEEDLGNRPERMVELCFLISMVLDAKLKMFEFLTRAMLPTERETIAWSRKAVEFRKDMPGKYHKMKLAKSMVQLAFNLSSFSLIGGDSEFTASDAAEEGRQRVAAAITIYEEYNDKGLLAEALMTKAILCLKPMAEQLKLYEESMNLCQQAYGDLSVLAGRLYINMGIYYEETCDYGKAYEFFCNNYRVHCQVLGADHPKTIRAKAILMEPMYKRKAAERGDESLLTDVPVQNADQTNTLSVC